MNELKGKEEDYEGVPISDEDGLAQSLDDDAMWAWGQ